MSNIENYEKKLDLFEQQTKKLESDLNKEVSNWESIIKKLTSGSRGNIKNIPEIEADVINYKQLVDSDIRKYSLMLYKDNSSIKPLFKKRFEFYSTSYQIKLKNSSDIKALIEADINKIQYKVDLLDAHIAFLRDTSNNLKSLSYTFKNRIELLNILGLD